MHTTFYTYISAPVGPLLLSGTEAALTGIHFSTGGRARAPQTDWRAADEPLREAKRQLQEYFAGERTDFELKIEPHGTAFQLDVLAALREIPYGETRAYQDIAERIGRPKAVRAVGAANGRNPIPIVIPCHRVIGRDGSLTGFGGGLDAKRVLLNLEQRQRGLFSDSQPVGE